MRRSFAALMVEQATARESTCPPLRTDVLSTRCGAIELGDQEASAPPEGERRRFEKNFPIPFHAPVPFIPLSIEWNQTPVRQRRAGDIDQRARAKAARLRQVDDVAQPAPQSFILGGVDWHSRSLARCGGNSIR